MGAKFWKIVVLTNKLRESLSRRGCTLSGEILLIGQAALVLLKTIHHRGSGLANLREFHIYFQCSGLGNCSTINNLKVFRWVLDVIIFFGKHQAYGK